MFASNKPQCIRHPEYNLLHRFLLYHRYTRTPYSLHSTTLKSWVYCIFFVCHSLVQMHCNTQTNNKKTNYYFIVCSVWSLGVCWIVCSTLEIGKTIVHWMAQCEIFILTICFSLVDCCCIKNISRSYYEERINSKHDNRIVVEYQIDTLYFAIYIFFVRFVFVMQQAIHGTKRTRAYWTSTSSLD